MTPRQHARLLQAQRDAADFRRWCKRHPNAPEAVALFKADEKKVLTKVQRRMEADARRAARRARIHERKARITASRIAKHFALDPRHASGLRRIADVDVWARLDSVRTASGTKWKISMIYEVPETGATITKSMWSARAANLLTQYNNI